MEPVFKRVKISDLIVPEVKIRGVQTDTSEFQALVRSIAIHGIEHEPYVTDVVNAETGKKVPGVYTLVDGLQRVEAAKKNGLTEITVKYVPNLSQDDLLVLQHTLNVHRIPQKPKETLEHIKRLAFLHPDWDAKQLGDVMAETKEKIQRMLKLDNLTPEALILVDEGKMKLTHGIALSTLPKDNQNDYLEKAMTTPADRWIAEVGDIKKSIAKAAKEGKSVGEDDIITPHPLKRVDIITLWESLQHDFEQADPGQKVAYAIATARLELIKQILQIDDATIKANKEAKELRKIEAAEDRKVAADKKAKEAADEVKGRRAQHKKMAESLA